jgi:hypothetical protein
MERCLEIDNFDNCRKEYRKMIDIYDKLRISKDITDEEKNILYKKVSEIIQSIEDSLRK